MDKHHKIMNNNIIDGKNDDLYMKYMNKESMSFICFQDNIENDDEEIFSTFLIIEELKRIKEIKKPDTKIICNLIGKIKK